MFNSTPQKAVISTLNLQCIICGFQVSSQDRVSIFGRSKFDLKGAISELVGGELQCGDQNHYLCTKKCLGKIKKYLKLSENLTELRGALKKELTSATSRIRIKRGFSEDLDLSPIKNRSQTTTTNGSIACSTPAPVSKATANETPFRTCLFPVNDVITPLVISNISQEPGKSSSSSSSHAQEKSTVVTVFSAPLVVKCPGNKNPSQSLVQIPIPSAQFPEKPPSKSSKKSEQSTTIDKKPSVQVILKYPNCDKAYRNYLEESLHPLGKALARRFSYPKIATAIFRSEPLKKAVIKQILTILAKEYVNLCSKKNPSILRSKEPNEMLHFKLSDVCAEFQCRAPLFYSVLLTCATSNKEIDWLPSVAVAGSVLLKQRNMHMNATQSLISLMVKQDGIQKLLNRLNTIKLTLSSKTTLKRLDSFGSMFKQELKKLKVNCTEITSSQRDNSNRQSTSIPTNAENSNQQPTLTATSDNSNQQPTLTTTSDNSNQQPTLTPTIVSNIDVREQQSSENWGGSFKVTLDNIDLRILTRDMTADRQNKDIHWCNHVAVKDRAVYQQGAIKQTDLLELENAKILPEVEDHKNLRKDFEKLVAQILVEHLPCFSFLKDACPKHIPHKYIKEMAEKSEKIPLGVIFKSENISDEMAEILHQIQGYSGTDGITIPVVGDQVTLERGVNVIAALQNGYTHEERLDGVHMEIADWHSIVTFLRVIFNRHYSPSSDADKCTLFANRNLINRRNVVADVTSNWAPCKAFMLLDIKARVLAAAMKILGMQNLDDQPQTFTISDPLKNASMIIKQLYLQKVCAAIVEEFIINQDLQQKMIDSILTNQEAENLVNNQELTPDGKFPCRFPGCNKVYVFDGKSRRNHELTHDPPPEVPEPPSLTADIPVTKKIDENNEKQDDMFNYNCSILNHGLLFLNFLDATAEGDGYRLIRCWKFFLLHFKEEKSTPKYALEALYLQFQILSLLPPEKAFSIIHNRTVNNKGGPGRNVSLDLDLEHENNYLKQAIKKLGPNVNPAPVSRICRAHKVTKTMLDNFDTDQCRIVKKSGKHTIADYSKDLKTIVNQLVKESVCTFTPGRHYTTFSGIKRDALANMDMSKVFQWINMHKKNIDLARKAR